MQNIKWAMIGVGRFGKIHARFLSSLPGSELLAISNRHETRLTEAATEFQIETASTDYRDILADLNIDAVCPPPTPVG